MKLAVWTIAFCLLASTVWADVIPNQVPDQDDSRARAAVSERLQKLGVSESDALAQARAIPSSVASHYAACPDALQWVAGDGEEEESEFGTGEILLGVVYLAAGIAATIAPFYVNNND